MSKDCPSFEKTADDRIGGLGGMDELRIVSNDVALKYLVLPSAKADTMKQPGFPTIVNVYVRLRDVELKMKELLGKIVALTFRLVTKCGQDKALRDNLISDEPVDGADSADNTKL